MKENILLCPLFEGMTSEQVNKLLNNQVGKRTYKKGETIIFQGDNYDFIHILLSGEVITMMSNVEGKSMIIETIPAPNVLAPAIFYSKDDTMPVDVVANDEVCSLPISKADFTFMLENNRQLMINFIKIISNRSSFLANKVRIVCFKTIKSNFAGYLLNISKQNNNLSFSIPNSQQELSERFGVTRPALANVIGDLIKEGIIVSKGKEFKILNLNELIRIYNNK